MKVYLQGGTPENPWVVEYDAKNWNVGRAGELVIYNNDAKPGNPGVMFLFGCATPPTPPKPPTVRAVHAPGTWLMAIDT